MSEVVLERLPRRASRSCEGALVERVSGDGAGIRVDIPRAAARVIGLPPAGRRRTPPQRRGPRPRGRRHRVTPRGITVDEGLGTTNRRVYAIGDVAGGRSSPTWPTTTRGSSSAMRCSACPPRLPTSMPWVTYTDPELAQAGLTEAEARARHGDKVNCCAGPSPRMTGPRPRGGRGLDQGGDGPSRPDPGRRHRGAECGRTDPAVDSGAGAGPQDRRHGHAVLPYPTRGEAGRRAAVNYFQDLHPIGWSVA